MVRLVQSNSCSSVLLIVTGPNLDPAQATEMLSLEPWRSWRAGEPTAGGTNHHDEGGWKARVPDDLLNEPLDVQFDHWVRQLRRCGAALKMLRDEGNKVELNCFTAGSDGFVASHTVLAELAECGVDLEVTISCDASA